MALIPGKKSTENKAPEKQAAPQQVTPLKPVDSQKAAPAKQKAPKKVAPVKQAPAKKAPPKPSISPEHDKITEWLKTVQFEHVVFGGVDELDVWRKFEELNRMYEVALAAERARYDIMIEEYRKTCAASIQKAKAAAASAAVSGEKAGNE